MKKLIGYVAGAYSPDGKLYNIKENTIWKIIEKSEENYIYEFLKVSIKNEIPKTLYGKKVYSSEEVLELCHFRR